MTPVVRFEQHPPPPHTQMHACTHQSYRLMLRIYKTGFPEAEYHDEIPKTLRSLKHISLTPVIRKLGVTFSQHS
jgi:hypothetical protein